MLRAALQLEELVGQAADSIQKRIVESNGRVAITFSLQDTYHSTSKLEIALSALKAWYMGERIAEFCISVKQGEDEGAHGEGCFFFHADVRDSAGLARFLCDLASAFDPDDLETEAELGSEAQGWLESRDETEATFPEMERAYMIDAEQAAECAKGGDC